MILAISKVLKNIRQQVRIAYLELCFIRMLEILTLSHASKLRYGGRVVETLDWPPGILSFYTRFKIFYMDLLSVKPCR